MMTLCVRGWSRCRGHFVYWDGNDWYYTDGKSYDDTRICPECKIPHTPHGPDACLGWKPGVTSMCCTHGGRQDAIYMTTKRIGP